MQDKSLKIQTHAAHQSLRNLPVGARTSVEWMPKFFLRVSKAIAQDGAYANKLRQEVDLAHWHWTRTLEMLDGARGTTQQLRAQVNKVKALRRMESEEAGAREVVLSQKLTKAREKVDRLILQGRELHAETTEATARRHAESEQSKARDAALSQKLNETREEMERQAHELRVEADEANAHRRAESEQAKAREAALSQKLNASRARDAKAAVEIARLNVEKAVLKRELHQLATAGGTEAGDAEAEVKRELEVELGWAFGRA